VFTGIIDRVGRREKIEPGEPGEGLDLEADLLGKYVRRRVERSLGAGALGQRAV